jgi:hypothetical protein
MICPLEQRLKDMAAVTQRLAKIEAWEKEARLPAISLQTIARIQNLESTAQENSRINAENSAARLQEGEKLSAVGRGFGSWLQCELEKVASHIASAGVLKSAVRPVVEDGQTNWNIQTSPNSGYRAISCFELRLMEPEESLRCEHILQIRLCEELRLTMSSHVGRIKPSAQPVRDQELAMVPVYRRTSGTRASAGIEFGGFFTMKEAAGKIRGILPSPGALPYPHGNTVRIEPVTKSFHQGLSQIVPFRTSEWPLVTDRLRAGLQLAVDAFIDFVSAGASFIGN